MFDRDMLFLEIIDLPEDNLEDRLGFVSCRGPDVTNGLTTTT